MKPIFTLLLLITSLTKTIAQNNTIDILYDRAMSSYNSKDYNNAALTFDSIQNLQNLLSSNLKYDGACIYALNAESEKAFKLLINLADSAFYSDLAHVSTDADLISLHNLPQWNMLIEKISDNKATLPARRRNKITTELLKTKALLNADNGKLWGENLWNEKVLVLDDENRVYTLSNSLDNTDVDSILHFKKIHDGALNYTSTNQLLEGNNWAIIRNDHVTPDDNCEVIIHELFHLTQAKHIKLSGNIVEYLDETDARILLRLEFSALRNALQSADDNNRNEVLQYLNDAMIFRKERETKYIQYKKQALELETLEGLANYTGYKLSAYNNLYQKAITDISAWENSGSLNRSFPYATGFAYGLLFDYLKAHWRTDLNQTYDFRLIYETEILRRKTTDNINSLQAAKSRNNFIIINKDEQEKKIEHENIYAFYDSLFIQEPTLTVHRDTADKTYLMSYDMNGTFVFHKAGIIYTQIVGNTTNPMAFGTFATLEGKEKIGQSGVLITSNFDQLTFPKPISIEENRITGDTYSISLNEGWQVVKINNKGDLRIEQKKK